MFPEISRKFPWLLLLLCLGWTALLRLPSLDLPLDRDEGEYASLAWTWSHGLGLPYRDYLEQKPPLSILLNRAAFAIGGESPEALRRFALLWQLLCDAALFLLLWRHRESAFVATCAALLYACLSVSARCQGLAANTESWMSLPLILAFFFLLPEAESRHWLLAGLALGLAALAKQSALPALLLLPFLLEEEWVSRARALLWAMLGALVFPGLAWLYFALQGGAAAFWNCVVGYNFSYAGQGSAPWNNLFVAFWNLGREDWPLWVALGLGAWMMWKESQEGSRLYWVWFLAVLCGSLLGGRPYPHYFLPLAAPLSALVALILAANPRLWWRGVILGFYALFFALGNIFLWTAEDGAARSVALYGLDNFAKAPAIAAAIEQRTPQGSKLFVWGAEAELFFLSSRQPATRFLFDYPFTGEAPPWPGGGDELLQAMEDPSTAAVVLEPGFDYRDPLQRRLGERLEQSFELHADLVPGVMIGFRKS
jgi:4-amino-4-deoxy-L-arabinose transferase-like glycosyltransferase